MNEEKSFVSGMLKCILEIALTITNTQNFRQFRPILTLKLTKCLELLDF